MHILKRIYEKRTGNPAPYYFNYSIFTIMIKPLRKWFTNVFAANCPFNCVRIFVYRLCGFEIGRGTFIGMRCYLDDMCYDLLKIGNNVTISYGVYFACHGRNQEHLPIIIEDNTYIGMRASIISKNSSNLEGSGTTIGAYSVIGAGSLVNRDVPAYATVVGVPCRIIEKDMKEDK